MIDFLSKKSNIYLLFALLFAILYLNDGKRRCNMRKFEIPLGDATLVISVASDYQNHFNTPINAPHFHIDKEIHVVLDGTATLDAGGKSIPTAAGDIYVVPENVSHYYKDHSDGFNKISFLFTLVKKRSAKKSFSEYAHYTGIFAARSECITLSDERLTELGRELFSLGYTEAAEHICQALYAVFFIRLAGLVESRCPALAEPRARGGRSRKDSLEEKKIVEDFFFRRYSESVSIEDLARALYKSVPQTHRIVKSYFGESFKTILVRQRMERAALLAREGEKTFGEIAFTCGYSSYNGFLAAFKKYTGKAPEEYRISEKTKNVTYS